MTGVRSDTDIAKGPSVTAAPTSTPSSTDQAAPAITLSVVVPVLNEAANIAGLVGEITAALNSVTGFEIIYVDDGSSDDSMAILTGLKADNAHLRVIRHNRRAGQSAGTLSGVRAARGRLIATLDGDGQNDPADIPKLLTAYEGMTGSGPRMVTGHRVNRRDVWSKRVASRLANKLRGALLRDANPDTGCALKLFEREMFLALPYFDHMHRFLPALAKRQGCMVAVVPVNHRGRVHGDSKYSNLGRLLVGIPDLLGVAWLMRRAPADLEREEV